MNKYHKISTVFKRDPENNFKTLLFGEFATPELEYLQDNMWVFTEKVDGTNKVEEITDKIKVLYYLILKLVNGG